MQAISDELLEILASRLQAGSRGYGCRVEIDYLVPGFTELGTPQDLNLAHGTVTRDVARHTGDGVAASTYYVDTAKANDGNDSTEAIIATGITGAFADYLKADLGAAYECTAFNVLVGNDPGRITDFQYSTDGMTWISLTGTETGVRTAVPGGATFTFTAPVTARYWAIEASQATSGLHPTHELGRWEIRGTATSEVADSLGTTSYQVSACSIDKSRRMAAGQAEIEIPVADGSADLLVPGGPIVTNAAIRIYQWYGDVANEVLVFTGSIDEIREGRDPRTIRIVARDMMKRLIVQTFGAIGPQGADEDGNDRTPPNGVYLNMDVDEIVNDILDRAGVPDDKRSVAATGYGLDEYVIPDGASWADAIIGDDALTGLTGYDMWADELGVLHFESVLSNRATDSDTDPTPDYAYVIGGSS